MCSIKKACYIQDTVLNTGCTTSCQTRFMDPPRTHATAVSDLVAFRADGLLRHPVLNNVCEPWEQLLVYDIVVCIRSAAFEVGRPGPTGGQVQSSDGSSVDSVQTRKRNKKGEKEDEGPRD